MRKTATVSITDEGRDKGKTFIINEKTSWDSEDWAARVLFAAMNAGIEIPDEIAQAGLAGVASLGIKALTKIPYEAAKPLLDSMMECVQIQPSAGVTRDLIEDDIEEVKTLLRLRTETIKLHIDPFTNDAPLTSAPAKAKTRAS